MVNTVVVGAQWGDEGKAKITDILAEKADLIIRYQGGCNAGHTVVVGDETYKFHLVPSGILYKDKVCLIGAGCVVYPEVLKNELEDLISRGINPKNLRISPLATITMPYHVDLDGASESSELENKIGTTKKGIGPTYSDKIGRLGIKFQDLYDIDSLNKRLDKILPLKNKFLQNVYGLKTYSKEEILKYCSIYADYFKDYVCFDWQKLLTEAKNNNKTVLFEGAQGVMLDIDYGTYPYVTSSNPIAGGACTGSGFGPCQIQNVIGVLKAYITRVGEGPFITELEDEIGNEIRTIGSEFGTTTGRPRRCGWFDAVIARYAVLVSGLSSMVITKLDIFDSFNEIKVCTAYKDSRNGDIYEYYPTNINIHKFLEPVYETHPGWGQDITNAKSFNELPINAQKYLKRLEELVGVPVSIISVGAKREQTIFTDKVLSSLV